MRLANPKLYLDLDGVLANFDKRVEELLGTDNIYKWEFIYGPKAFWDALNEADENFFVDLEPMPGADRLFDTALTLARGDLSILTALPRTNAGVVDRDKRRWVEGHFGDV